jgi:hypothetical protein
MQNEMLPERSLWGNVSLAIPRRHIYIADLAERFHARSDPWKGFAVIWGYFDDAGTHGGAEVTSIGGMVGTVDAWCRFEADWEAVIDDFRECGLTAFRAYDCEVGDGDFVNFQSEIRSAISRRFARVVAKHTDLRIFWSSVVNAGWDRATDDAFRDRYRKPFGLCFEWCVQQVSEWSTAYAGASPVSLVFSEQPDFQDRMYEIFGCYLGAKGYTPLQTLTFGSYRDIIALQGADQVATEINRYWRAAELDPETFRSRPEIIELRKGRGLHLGGCYDEPAILNAVRQYRANFEILSSAGRPS